MPAGEATAAVNIGIDRDDARRIAYTVLAYIQAYDVARAVWQLYEANHPKP